MDKWLWAARFFKTRALAAKACELGRIESNQHPAKAARDVRVGDMLAFDICHPCLTFDKWRTLPVLDANYQVVDIVQTFF